MHFGYENSAQEYKDKKKAFSFIPVMDDKLLDRHSEN